MTGNNPDIIWDGEPPVLKSPVLVVALKGWIDAAEAAAEAMSTIEAQSDRLPVASFDPDVFIDYRSRRPTMEIREGRTNDIDWPSIDLWSGRDANGRDVLLLTGNEPDGAWNRFSKAMREICVRFGVRMMVGLGAYPFPAPHTRPSRISCTSPSEELLSAHHFLRTSVDIPAGMQAVLEQVLHGIGIPSITIWAQVPQYAASMSCPAASMALIEGLREVSGLSFDKRALEQEAILQRDRLDRLVRRNDEHREMVAKYEASYDAAVQPTLPLEPAPLRESDIPSPDELAAELEAFLRDGNSDNG